jgi:hypothetical protein
MAQKAKHRPGRPASRVPPDDLAVTASSIDHPLVTRSGLTTTADGRWALMVRVKPGTRTPIPAVETLAAEHPVVYEEEPSELPVARPAYPDRGE